MEKKKLVLITGCSDGGIGSELAKQFAAKGYRVFATVRTSSKARSLHGVAGIEVLKLEVTSRASIATCAVEVARRTGCSPLDVLVNNAGADFVVPFLDVSIDEARELYEANVFSIIGVTQAFAPMVLRAQGGGCIVNMGSISAEMPLCWTSIYSSSKAAAKQLSEIMRTEMAPLGVRVITAVVGAVHTPIHERAGELRLPRGSRYAHMRDHISEVRKGAGAAKPAAVVDVATVCRALVADIEGEKSGVVWRGGSAAAVRFLSWILPRGLWEWVVNYGRGLEMVARPALG